MGGAEHDYPPSKRVKVSSEELDSFSKGTSLRDLARCSLSDLMARPLESQGDNEVVGVKGVVKKVELVRIIAEALYSLGYKKTGALLEEESGILLHSSNVNLFMQQIIDGKWDESVATLRKISLMDENIVKLASFVILEQKFFELLDGDRVMDALKTLRTEIAPVCIHTNRLHELSSLVVSPSQPALNGTSDQQSRIRSRKKLLEELKTLLPSTVVIPENRLVCLVEQALDLQKDACRFHNSLVDEMSLLADHQCGRDHIPSQTLQILQEHINEVWFLQFSHNGEYLASSSSDCLVIIWEVPIFDLACDLHDMILIPIMSASSEKTNEVKGGGQVSLKHRLSGHQKPVSYISWSPDDHQLLTCGVEESVRCWDTASGNCLQVYEKGGLGFISCAWAPDGRRIFCGVTDKSICMWDLDGKEVECLKGQKTNRISDLGISSDGKQLITVCKENMISLFGWESNSEKFIEEDHTIISFTLSEDKKFLLVSLANQELHLWSIDGNTRLVAKYRGHRRSRLVVRSCFGGLEQAFIASGSEDSQVYIWHRVSGELILTLPGHSGAVNCVSWNPANPHMLASASDDRTIRIWGLNQVNMTQNEKHSNGVRYCNGAT